MHGLLFFVPAWSELAADRDAAMAPVHERLKDLVAAELAKWSAHTYPRIRRAAVRQATSAELGTHCVFMHEVAAFASTISDLYAEIYPVPVRCYRTCLSCDSCLLTVYEFVLSLSVCRALEA